MKRMTTKKGFTLVELAVVIVIIGVLAAFAVPRFRASVERSKAAESFNYLSSIQAAMERYHARQGTYASDVNDLHCWSSRGRQHFKSGRFMVSDSYTCRSGCWLRCIHSSFYRGRFRCDDEHNNSIDRHQPDADLRVTI
jgi:prepilin-type N-terminal cleavage/methylation domain-containing protein